MLNLQGFQALSEILHQLVVVSRRRPSPGAPPELSPPQVLSPPHTHTHQGPVAKLSDFGAATRRGPTAPGVGMDPDSLSCLNCHAILVKSVRTNHRS